MNNRFTKLASGIGAIMVIGVCVFIVSRNWNHFSGECADLSQLPCFGASLPAHNLGYISYEGERINRQVFARVRTTAQEFEMLAGELKLSTLRYKTGFNDPGLESVNQYFRPSGNKVSAAWGLLHKKGRTTIRLYFEPSNIDDANGILYIHVS